MFEFLLVNFPKTGGDAINGNILLVDKTKFILYSNFKGREALVDMFHSVTTPKEAEDALEATKKELKEIDKQHDIWKYYEKVLSNEELFKKIILRFELQVGEEATYDDVRIAIKEKLVAESQVDYLLNALGGWLQEVICQKIKNNQKAIVTWQEFYKKFSSLFESSRRRELIDFTLTFPPKEAHVQEHVKVRPYYIQQLEIINIAESDILEAVYEFLKADINRTKWIENEIINEEVASDFEKKLVSFWKNQVERIKITETHRSDEEKGKLLLIDCKSRSELLSDSSPPYPTIAGTYHALANSDNGIGWHPKWREKLKIKKEGK